MSERAQAWSARFRPREVELTEGQAAGLTVLVRPVRLDALVEAGTIPLPVWEGFQEARQSRRPGDRRGMFDEETLKTTRLINVVVMAAATDPRVTETGEEEGSIPLNWLSIPDRYRIFDEVLSPINGLSTFPGEPDGSAADAPGGEDVREAAE